MSELGKIDQAAKDRSHDLAMQEAEKLLKCSYITSSMEAFQDLAEIVYEVALAKGLYDQPFGFQEALDAMGYSLKDALQHYTEDTMDERLASYPKFQVDLADSIIAILRTCGEHEVPIGDILLAKMLWNLKQPLSPNFQPPSKGN